tara:strand:+ start:921 stop:1211 length:291 start_codon:yes stop_codon:yes gene_type:complete
MVEPKPKKAPETTEVKEEEPTVKTTSILEEPTLTIEDDSKTLSPTEFVESLAELKDKAKAAGLRPIQNMVTSYISQGLAMVDGLLESLEGKKKKGK